MKLLAPLLLLVACGGTTPASSSPSSEGSESKPSEATTEPSEASETAKEPDAWADWKSWTNVSPGPWISKTHGSRFVEIYVNDVALAAYKQKDAPLPVGSIVVKPSWENEDGAPGAEGPLFVMEKMPEGFAPDSEDWLYVFQWESPPEKWAAKIGTNVDWRSPSEKAEYCSDCHDVMDRALGMPPAERRADWGW